MFNLESKGSWRDMDWIEDKIKARIEIELGPGNTTHYLQLIEQWVNCIYKRDIRFFRTEMASLGIVNIRYVSIKLMVPFLACKEKDITSFIRS